MLPLQFFGQNIHFAISLFAALVFFAVFWLYFDAWTADRETKVLVKAGSFLLVALSFVVHATVIEQSVLGKSLLGNVSEALTIILRIVGYIGIIIGQLVDPLQEKPKLTGLSEAEFQDTSVATPNTPVETVAAEPKKTFAVGFGSVANVTHLLLPLGALTIAGLYWRRATTGLERHLKPVAVAFAFLTGFEILSLASLWRTTDNTIVAKLVASFGLLWIVEQLFLLAGALVLGLWVWRYLTRRFFSQLFMIFTTVTLGIFLATAVSFTFLLVNNVQRSSLDNLQTANNVLHYAIDAKKAETLANASAVAENPNVVAAVQAHDNKALTQLTSNFLRDRKQSSLTITSDTAQVLYRAEDPTRYGDSVSSDTLVRRALIGQPSSSIVGKDGTLAPLMYIKSAAPVRDESGRVVGSVSVGLVADNGFVDGIKHSTGLDRSGYVGDVRAATTFVAPDGVSRLIGVKDTNSAVESKVLKKGKSFEGSVEVLNRRFLAVYAPLKDADNVVVGMLFIGTPETSILQAAGHSIELTFLVTVALLLLSVIPAFMVSKYIASQLE